MIVVYNKMWSTAEEQAELHAKLPISHEYGDRRSVLEDGSVIVGRGAHDEYMAPGFRVKTKKRCTLVDLEATHTGFMVPAQSLNVPRTILTCFVTIVDWHASGLDTETFFLRPAGTDIMPRVGPYSFNFTGYMASMYEDLVMAMYSVKSRLEGRKAHLKLVPLGVGPTIKNRYGDFLGPLIIPAYLMALQYACNEVIDDSWVDCVEFVDHTRGRLSPFVNIKKVRICSNSCRDAFDFEDVGPNVVPALIVPCDPFCRIGGAPTDKCLASTLANNSNLRSFKEPKFVSWP